MLMTTRRRIGAPAWAALGLVVGLPALAEAQLLPNRTIKRERTPCVNEPPFNAHVRREFYGYYPTCWTRFPQGWACPCPNPELPNVAASFQKRPLDPQFKPPANELDPGMELDEKDKPANPDMPAPETGLPEVPRNRSIFDLDPRPDATPTSPATPGGPATPAEPGDRPRVPGTGRPTTRSGDNPSVPPSTSLLELPNLPTPPVLTESRLEPGALALAPEATLASTTASDRPDLGPLPPAPMPAASTPMIVDRPMVGASVPSTNPAQAPRRRSLIGGLFGSGNRARR